MKAYVPASYEEETYCCCMDMQTQEWFWVKTEKPHDYKAAEQKLVSLGKQYMSLGSWYTYEEYLYWSSGDEPLF